MSPEITNLINSMIKVKASERATLEDCRHHSWTLNQKLSLEQIKKDEIDELSSKFNFTDSNIKYKTNSTTNEKEDIKLNKVKEFKIKNYFNSPDSHKSSDKSSSSEEEKNHKNDRENLVASNSNYFNLQKKKVSFMNVNNTANKESNRDLDNNEFDFNNYLRNTNKNLHSTKSITRINRPGLVTKVNKSKDINVYQINYDILKSNGKIVNYLQPIGFTKEQKQQADRIKELLMRNYTQSKSTQHCIKKDKLKEDENETPNNKFNKISKFNDLKPQISSANGKTNDKCAVSSKTLKIFNDDKDDKECTQFKMTDYDYDQVLTEKKTRGIKIISTSTQNLQFIPVNKRSSLQLNLNKLPNINKEKLKDTPNNKEKVTSTSNIIGKYKFK